MPLLETKGAGSAQGFGLSLGGEEAVYVEDVFSTYLYTGTGATQTITNGIDLAGEGGLVWGKHRAFAVDPVLYDTERGINQRIQSSTTQAETTRANTITSFNSDGVTLGTGIDLNESGRNIVLWTFRKQPKFFDVVTYTGNGSNRTIAHDLGSVPGCIIVKKTSGADNWFVQHRSLGATKYIALNDADIAYTNSQIWNNTEPTSTVFTLGTNSGVNQSGATYVAYLFAHDAGGFGLTGTDNVISCGSFSAAAPPQLINLGWEAQFILVKKASGSGDWFLIDVMRGASVRTSGASTLSANSSAAEVANNLTCYPDAQGFRIEVGDGNWIYIAIRRGPMKVPTSGTSVFTPLTYTGSSTQGTLRNAGFTVDAVFSLNRSNETNKSVYDRLRGAARILLTTQTDAEVAQTGAAIGLFSFANNVGYLAGEDQSSATINFDPRTYVNYMFRRAPGFFDEVCLNSTTSAAQVLSHNLGVAPELIISKGRNVATPWQTMDATNYLRLNTDQADIGVPQYHTFTSTTFSINSGACSSGENWVFYLFATLAGVSKYGTYTGTGTTQVINCGFTAGSRFVMIKRTDSTGDWYVWDSARGIVAGNDPYLLLNSTAAEVTNTDYVDTASTGFEISSTAPAAINANGGTFIFLAIA